LRRATCLLPLLTLAHCGGIGPQSSKSSLVGEWVMLDGALQYPTACGAHGTITYSTDGKSYLWGETGTWRLEGNVLTEETTFADPMHSDTKSDDVGRPYVSSIQWIRRDRFLKKFHDGEIREFRRCPYRQ